MKIRLQFLITQAEQCVSCLAEQNTITALKIKDILPQLVILISWNWGMVGCAKLKQIEQLFQKDGTQQ